MKKLFALLLTVAMVFSLMAMSGSAFADDGNTLSVYAWDANFNIPALKAAEAAFQKVHPDFKLDIATQSGSSDVEQAMTLAGSSGDLSSLPDIVLFQDHFIQSYVADYPDCWQSLEGADINWDDFGAEKLSYSTIDGVHYGAPVDNGTAIFAYRTDVLEQAGYTIADLTGITWDRWLEIARDVKAKTGFAFPDGEEVFPGAVAGQLPAGRLRHADFIVPREGLASGLGYVCHLADAPDFPDIEPARQLLAGETRQSGGEGDFFQLVRRFSQQSRFHTHGPAAKLAYFSFPFTEFFISLRIRGAFSPHVNN